MGFACKIFICKLKSKSSRMMEKLKYSTRTSELCRTEWWSGALWTDLPAMLDTLTMRPLDLLSRGRKTWHIFTGARKFTSKQRMYPVIGWISASMGQWRTPALFTKPHKPAGTWHETSVHVGAFRYLWVFLVSETGQMAAGKKSASSSHDCTFYFLFTFPKASWKLQFSVMILSDGGATVSVKLWNLMINSFTIISCVAVLRWRSLFPDNETF